MHRSTRHAVNAVRETLILVIVGLMLAVTVLCLVPPARADDGSGTGAGTRRPKVDAAVEAATASGVQVPVMVRLRGGTGPGGSPASRRQAERVAATLPSDTVRDARPVGDLPMLTATVDAGGLEALERSDAVTDVVPNRKRHVELSQSVSRVGAPTAWTAGFDGAGQAIAVLDTGVDKSHPFLTGKVVAEGCFSSAIDGSTPICPGGDPTTSTSAGAGVPCTITFSCFHGTHVAGIAAGGSGQSFSGVAPGAQIIAVQVFSAGFTSAVCSPSPAPCITAWESDIVRGLDYVLDLSASLEVAAVNLSLGGDPLTYNCTDEPEMPLIGQLRDLGIPTVVAAGNEGDKAALSAPACVPGTVSVGSTNDLSDSVSGYSNSSPALSLLAPGSLITSSVPFGTAGSFACPAPFASGPCLNAQGTSMATPHVAAAFAIAHQMRPGYSVTDNLSLLRSTGLPVQDTANGIVTPRLRIDTLVRPPTYRALPPARILDTRDGTGTSAAGPIGPGGVLELQITGTGGVPATGVSAVVLNVTSVSPTAESFVTLWPSGMPRPLASNLNLEAGETRANLATVALGVNGRISLFNNTGLTHLVADVAGYYDAGGTNDTGARYRAGSPTRAFDTRDGTGGVPAAPLGPGATLTVDVASSCGFDGVSAVALNLTALDATTRTHVTAWPTGSTRPLASNLNLGSGPATPNLAYVKVGVSGSVSFFNNTGSIDLLADLEGCFDDGSSTSGRFVPVAPSRVLDTRDGTGTAGTQPVGAGESVDVTVAGVGGVPASGVSAVVMNVTATEPTQQSHVTAWPTGQPMPLASNLNMAPGQTAPNLVVVGVGAGGAVSLFNNEGSSHLIVDVAGWYLA